jgi:hypothetical protein
MIMNFQFFFTYLGYLSHSTLFYSLSTKFSHASCMHFSKSKESCREGSAWLVCIELSRAARLSYIYYSGASCSC